MKRLCSAQGLAAICLINAGLNACSVETRTRRVSYSETTVVPIATKPTAKSKSLSEIDLSKIGHIAPKGRVQDKEYNNPEIVDELIRHGKESIPFLIGKLDDQTVIENSILDYWPKIKVGDVAFLILSDFSTDSTWKKETIPGGNWDNFFGTKPNGDKSAAEFYYGQIEKHERGWVKARWEKIWDKYRDQIVWDEQERCFKVFDDAGQ